MTQMEIELSLSITIGTPIVNLLFLTINKNLLMTQMEIELSIQHTIGTPIVNLLFLYINMNILMTQMEIELSIQITIGTPIVNLLLQIGNLNTLMMLIILKQMKPHIIGIQNLVFISQVLKQIFQFNPKPILIQLEKELLLNTIPTLILGMNLKEKNLNRIGIILKNHLCLLIQQN